LGLLNGRRQDWRIYGSPCIKRRIGRRAIRDYQMGKHKNLSHPFNVAPTKCEE
jgi:hypothetical protein